MTVTEGVTRDSRQRKVPILYFEVEGVPFCRATLWPVDGQPWMVTAVDVGVRQRGKGHGSNLLRQVCEHLDEMEADATLYASPDGTVPGLTLDELIEWYGRYGFVVEDPEEPALLTRRVPEMTARKSGSEMADTSEWRVLLESPAGDALILETTSGLYRQLDMRLPGLSAETAYLGVLVGNRFWHAFTGDETGVRLIAQQLLDDAPMDLTPQQQLAQVHPLLPYLPVTESSALTAAEVATLAGENRRSAGTKLNALSRKDKRVQARFDADRRQNLWWRSEA